MQTPTSQTFHKNRTLIGPGASLSWVQGLATFPPYTNLETESIITI